MKRARNVHDYVRASIDSRELRALAIVFQLGGPNRNVGRKICSHQRHTASSIELCADVIEPRCVVYPRAFIDLNER